MKTMTGDGQFKARPPVVRSILVVLLVTAALLMVPLVAMQFTSEVNWTPADFVAAGVLLAGTGTLYVLASRRASSARQRAWIGAALALALVVVWVELAVGIFD